MDENPYQNWQGWKALKPAWQRSDPIQICQTNKPVPYDTALDLMQKTVGHLQQQPQAPGLIWLLEHPAIVTLGSGAFAERKSLPLLPKNIELHHSKRGGQATYHGPGQRVVYVMLNLNHYRKDVRHYIQALESWVMAALAEIEIKAYPDRDLVGLWVKRQNTPSGQIPGEDKIAAIGVRLSRWVTSHGFAINYSNDLEIYRYFTPCGISDPRYGVTSVHAIEQNFCRTNSASRLLDQALLDQIPNFMSRLSASSSRRSRLQNE